MARIVCTVVLIVLLNVLAGCGSADTGKGQLMSPRTQPAVASVTAAQLADAAEVDLVEQMSAHRQAYRQALQSLTEHYNKTGNNLKLQWAKKEMAALDAAPQYKYIIEAAIAGPDLRATAVIPEANDLYNEAVTIQKEAERLVVVKDKTLLRLALDKYNQLIRKYPTSDKIDDAAFKAGEIYEYFKDYSITALYFERAYEWDAATPHPARFRRAYILDQHLHDRAAALDLYKQALETEGKQDKYLSWVQFAQTRVAELSKIAQPAQQ